MATTTTTAANDAPTTTYTAQMRNNDKHWIWKTGLRSLLLIVDIIGIGAVASIVAQMVPRYNDNVDQPYTSDTYYSSYGLFWFAWGLIPLGASVIWCSIVLLIHLIRRRPSHPGIAVGLDLILWLALIVTTIFIGIGLWDTYGSLDYGTSSISDYSHHSNYYGNYEQAANGTWIYKMTSRLSNSDQFFNTTTGTYQYLDTSTTLVREPCTPQYSSCEEQDAAFNSMMNGIAQQRRVGILGAACQGLALVLHFIVFVWACVDTSRRRRGSDEGRATVIAEKIIQDMVNRGQITVHQGAAQGTRPLLRPDSNHTAGSGAGGFGHGGQGQQQQQQQHQMMMNPAAAPQGGYYAPGSHHSHPQAPSPVALHANQYSRGPSPAPTSPLPQIPHQHHQQQQSVNRAPSPLAPLGMNTHAAGAHAHDPPSPISPAGGEAVNSGHLPHAS